MAKHSVKGDSYYGRVASNYEKRRQKQAWWHVEQDEMRALLEKLPKGLKVLDVPFGTGRFVTDYIARDFSISGLDASHEMIAQAMQILGADFKHCRVAVGTSLDLPFETDEFDLLVSTRFLRDIITFSDARKSLSEFARVTKKYAIIQLGEHSGDAPLTPGEDEPMGSDMSPKAVETLLNDHGFAIVEKREVQRDDAVHSLIHHILCERIR